MSATKTANTVPYTSATKTTNTDHWLKFLTFRCLLFRSPWSCTGRQFVFSLLWPNSNWPAMINGLSEPYCTRSQSPRRSVLSCPVSSVVLLAKRCSHWSRPRQRLATAMLLLATPLLPTAAIPSRAGYARNRLGLGPADSFLSYSSSIPLPNSPVSSRSISLSFSTFSFSLLSLFLLFF